MPQRLIVKRLIIAKQVRVVLPRRSRGGSAFAFQLPTYQPIQLPTSSSDKGGRFKAPAKPGVLYMLSSDNRLGPAPDGGTQHVPPRGSELGFGCKSIQSTSSISSIKIPSKLAPATLSSSPERRWGLGLRSPDHGGHPIYRFFGQLATRTRGVYPQLSQISQVIFVSARRHVLHPTFHTQSVLSIR